MRAMNPLRERAAMLAGVLHSIDVPDGHCTYVMVSPQGDRLGLGVVLGCGCVRSRDWSMATKVDNQSIITQAQEFIAEAAAAFRKDKEAAKAAADGPKPPTLTDAEKHLIHALGRIFGAAPPESVHVDEM